MSHPQDNNRPSGTETHITNTALNQGVQGTVIGPVTITNTSVQPPPAPATADPLALTPSQRSKLLALLAERYAERIQGNLAYAVRLQLGLHTRPAAVDPAWRKLHLRGPLLPSQPVPPGTPPLELFEQQKRQLLVLGAPGAGKTTLLVELAQVLTARAQADATQPIPVVLNLASWQTAQTIRDWLVGVLPDMLGVSKKFATQLAQGQELLLLLDGLDEVAEERRVACVEAVNIYLETVDIAAQLAVGSRSTEYSTLGVKLAIDGAVELEPLDLSTIEQALMNVPAAHSVLLALQTDDLLRELARTPLMVNVLLLTYAGQDVPTVQARSIEERRTALWTAYLRRMLVQRPLFDRWSPEQALRCLVWLAGLLRTQSETNFLLDDLQPEALPSEEQRYKYRGWVGLMVGGIAGLIFGPAGALVAGLGVGLTTGLAAGLGIGLASGLGIGLIFGAGSASLPIKRQERLIWSWARFWVRAREILRAGLRGGLGGGLVIGLGIGLIAGLVGGQGALLIGGVVGGLGGGLVGGLGLGLEVGLEAGWQIQEMSARSRPGEGIQASLKAGLVRAVGAGIVVGLGAGLGIGLGVALVSGAGAAVIIGLVFGVVFGLIVGLVFGLGSKMSGGLGIFLKHYALRQTLSGAGLLPFDTVAFLDALCDRLLLERDGAIYRFRHILLRDFCADLSDGQIAELAREADC
jgi:GTPase SAR1 family protein